MVTHDDGAVEPIRVLDSGVVYEDPETFGEYHLSYRAGDIVSPRVEAQEPLGLELADLLRAVHAGDRMEYQTDLCSQCPALVEAAHRSPILGRREVAPGLDETLTPAAGALAALMPSVA